jgi:hypothetical protein
MSTCQSLVLTRLMLEGPFSARRSTANRTGGVFCFITKPEDPAELERQLRTLLKHMSRLSGRRGANRLEATGAAGTHRMGVVRQLIRWVAVLAVLGGLVAFAQFVGLF